MFAGGASVVTLRDLSGKTIEVLQTNASTVTFDLSKLASGSYLIELTDTFGTQQQKFVKL